MLSTLSCGFTSYVRYEGELSIVLRWMPITPSCILRHICCNFALPILFPNQFNSGPALMWIHLVKCILRVYNVYLRYK